MVQSASRLIVLFATPVLHHPPIGGPTLRIENTIKALSEISELHIYCRASLEEIGGAEALSFYQNHSESFQFSAYSSLHQYIRFPAKVVNHILRKIIKLNLFPASLLKPVEDFQHFIEIADALRPDLIWLGYGNISYDLLSFIKENSSYKVVIDTDSVWSRYILRELPYIKDDNRRNKIEESGRKKEEEERWGTELSDVTTAVSMVDANYYSGLAKDSSKIHLFSNVIDLKSYDEVYPPPSEFQCPCMYLAGTFWEKSPMEQAARWVLDEVLPLVKQSIPDIHFYIVGQRSDEVLKDVSDPAVTVTGKLLSVLPYLCNANVAIVPLWFESGTRFKILEAGACGIPVVSTTLGAEGIPVTNGYDILIADTAEEFSKAIASLIQDENLSIRISQNLRKMIQERYSIKSLAQEGQKILDHLARF